MYGVFFQVTRLQYLNALMASRAAQSPDPPEIKILPNSQTKLLNDRNTTQGKARNAHACHALHDVQIWVSACCGMFQTLNLREQVDWV